MLGAGIRFDAHETKLLVSLHDASVVVRQNEGEGGEGVRNERAREGEKTRRGTDLSMRR